MRFLKFETLRNQNSFKIEKYKTQTAKSKIQTNGFSAFFTDTK